MSMQVESVAVVAEEEVQVLTLDDPPLVDRGLVEQLVGSARAQGVSIDGEGGLLTQQVAQ